jgi:hypothetical protein
LQNERDVNPSPPEGEGRVRGSIHTPIMTGNRSL